MNVLHLTTHLNPGGITVYIERLIEPLKKLGIRVFVFSSGGEAEQRLKSQGVELLSLPFRTKSILSPKLYKVLPGLKKYLHDNQIDVMHAHTRITQVQAQIMSRKTGIPSVTTCHGFYKVNLGRRFFPCWGNRVIAISGPVADDLKQSYHVPEKRIKLIHNGIDVRGLQEAFRNRDKAACKREFGFEPTDPVVGILARLVKDKGHEYLVRAVGMLQKDFPHLRLLIVGDGRERMPLQNLSKELGIEKAVVFTGHLKDIAKPLSALDLFALPVTWREGFGLSIVEAMACGIPVVVSNTWALNALIENGVTGMTVEPANSEMLAEVLRRLLEDLPMREAIGRAGQEMVEKSFTLEAMARDIAEVYRDVSASRVIPANCP